MKSAPQLERGPQSKNDPNDPARLFHFFRRISRDSSKTEQERMRTRIDCTDLIGYLGYWPDDSATNTSRLPKRKKEQCVPQVSGKVFVYAK